MPRPKKDLTSNQEFAIILDMLATQIREREHMEITDTLLTTLGKVVLQNFTTLRKRGDSVSLTQLKLSVTDNAFDFYDNITKCNYEIALPGNDYIENNLSCRWLYGDGKGSHNESVRIGTDGVFKAVQCSKTSLSFSTDKPQMFVHQGDYASLINGERSGNFVWRVFIFLPETR